MKLLLLEFDVPTIATPDVMLPTSQNMGRQLTNLPTSNVASSSYLQHYWLYISVSAQVRQVNLLDQVAWLNEIAPYFRQVLLDQSEEVI